MRYKPNKKLICDFEELIFKLEKDPFLLMGEQFVFDGMCLIKYKVNTGDTIGLAFNLNECVAIVFDEKSNVWRVLNEKIQSK